MAASDMTNRALMAMALIAIFFVMAAVFMVTWNYTIPHFSNSVFPNQDFDSSEFKNLEYTHAMGAIVLFSVMMFPSVWPAVSSLLGLGQSAM